MLNVLITTINYSVIHVLTSSAVVPVEASTGAVTLILVCTKSHTHACILTGVITTRIHCKWEEILLAHDLNDWWKVKTQQKRNLKKHLNSSVTYSSTESSETNNEMTQSARTNCNHHNLHSTNNDKDMHATISLSLLPVLDWLPAASYRLQKLNKIRRRSAFSSHERPLILGCES